MGDRTKIQQKKAVTSTYSQPTLAQKSIQGFGLSSFSSSQSIALPQNHDISRISLRPQAKLTVGQPGDIYEQEADSVAEQVMRMAVPETLEFSSAQTAQNSLQRKCAACENKEIQEIQRKAALQRAEESNIEQPNNIENQLSATQGAGSPLSDDVRGFMEPRFGADFSSVRVHTGSAAVQLSRDLGAQAFTYGSDIYFGAGKSPGNNDLTAHELTHVVQQTGGVQTKLNRNFPNSQHECSISEKEKFRLQRSIELQSTQVRLIQRGTDPNTMCNENGVCWSQLSNEGDLTSHDTPEAKALRDSERSQRTAAMDKPLEKDMLDEIAEGVIAGGVAGFVRGGVAGLASGGFAAARKQPGKVLGKNVGLGFIKAVEDQAAYEERVKRADAELARNEHLVLDNQSHAEGETYTEGQTGVTSPDEFGGQYGYSALGVTDEKEH